MKKADSQRKQTSNPTVSAVMDAIKSAPIAPPHARKVFREIARDLAAHRERFGEQMKKAEEELVRGCRRTKGDIV